MFCDTSHFLRRSRCAVGGFSGLSRNEAVREDQPFRIGIVIVGEVALALELQRLTMRIRGGCLLDKAATQGFPDGSSFEVTVAKIGVMLFL
jgi:hypothetical protein